MNSTRKSYLFAIFSVVMWSTVATAFKIALRYLDFIQLIFYASVVTVICLSIILAVQGKINDIFRQSRKQIIYSLLLGFLNPFLYYLVLFRAYSLLPAQLAQPLNMVWPVVLTLLSVPLLNQKIGKWSLAGLFVSFTGVIFISSQGGTEGFRNTSFLGVILALGSSFFWSLYWILNVRDKRDGIIKLFLSFISGLVFLTVFMILYSGFRVEFKFGLYAAAYVGIFETGITYILWMKAMQLSTNNAKIGNLIFLTPFISLFFIRFI
ncbi:MAG: DMT family transporter, partial [Prolixibacteraceae bacterium]|nr:DMT family transporter [Prolixibacteraceae bacterium]